jgi:membrane protein
LISLLFSLFIDNFSNFTVMYGSLTGIILTLLWLYFLMFLLFLG